ncbi:MAG: hypothetical protein LUG96_10360 [Tannerellaceae bacterium]|nr:hypothetical protein [Tannerellaceae bacterium]
MRKIFFAGLLICIIQITFAKVNTPQVKIPGPTNISIDDYNIIPPLQVEN